MVRAETRTLPPSFPLSSSYPIHFPLHPSLSLHLSIHPLFHPFLHLSIHPSLPLAITPPMPPSFYPSIYPPSAHPCLHPSSIPPSRSPSVHPFIHPSLHQSTTHPPTHHSFIHLSVPPFIHPSIHPPSFLLSIPPSIHSSSTSPSSIHKHFHVGHRAPRLSQTHSPGGTPGLPCRPQFKVESQNGEWVWGNPWWGDYTEAQRELQGQPGEGYGPAGAFLEEVHHVFPKGWKIHTRPHPQPTLGTPCSAELRSSFPLQFHPGSHSTAGLPDLKTKIKTSP